VVLEQAFPDGLSNATNAMGPSLAFPSFEWGGREDDLGAVTWHGAFSQASTVKLSELPSSAVGRSNGGPVLVFDEDDE
jgi:hypothetical protein